MFFQTFGQNSGSGVVDLLSCDNVQVIRNFANFIYNAINIRRRLVEQRTMLHN